MIRRLFKAPRVIVLVATIGVARALRGGHAHAPRLPNRLACRRSSHCRSQRHVAGPGLDIDGDGEPAARADRRAADRARSVVAARAHRTSATRCGPRRSNSDLARLTGISPEVDVHRRLGDRGLPRDDCGDPLRDRSAGSAELVHDRTRDAAARHDGRADRRDDVVPARHDRRRSSSAWSIAGAVRSTSRTRPASCSSSSSSSCSCSSRSLSRARRRHRRRELPVRAACPPRPRATPRHLVGATAPTVHRGLGPRRCRGDAAAHRQVGASPDLDDHPRLRHLRGLGHRAHRMGRSAVARADGIRRSRRLDRRRARPRPVGQHRLAQLPHHRRLAGRVSRSCRPCSSVRASRA